jgi:tRNA G46 methylase TrmB
LEDDLLARRLTWCFEFRPVSPSSSTESPLDGGAMPVYSGPSRVLEIGCSDGKWCHSFKKEQPTWIVEGVDDTDQQVFSPREAY